MNLSKYELRAEKSLMVFEFQSIGPKGKIPKLVKYSKTNLKGIYNVAFGDLNTITGEIDDQSISNNGDNEIILATVVSTIYAFTERYPDSMIYATGSNLVRTRLYRMGITKYINKITIDFDLYGLKDNVWQLFQKDCDYEAFLVKRKND